MRLAALAMYDWPEIREEVDTLWAALREALTRRGIAAPASLERGADYMAPWRSPRLLLAQTCGYPYARLLRGTVQLVATPAYAARGCRGARYSSVIIARRGGRVSSLADLGRATAAVNSADSQSGYWALRAAIARAEGALPPARAIATGSHRASLRLVAAGGADLAAIDCVSWALAERHDREDVARLQVVARSPEAPGLPIITAMATKPEELAQMREALHEALVEGLSPAIRAATLVKGVEILPDRAYDRILRLEREALAKPFPELEPAQGGRRAGSPATGRA